MTGTYFKLLDKCCNCSRRRNTGETIFSFPELRPGTNTVEGSQVCRCGPGNFSLLRNQSPKTSFVQPAGLGQDHSGTTTTGPSDSVQFYNQPGITDHTSRPVCLLGKLANHQGAYKQHSSQHLVCSLEVEVSDSKFLGLMPVIPLLSS